MGAGRYSYAYLAEASTCWITTRSRSTRFLAAVEAQGGIFPAGKFGGGTRFAGDVT